MADGNNVQIARSLTSTIRADRSDSDWTRPVFMLASAVQIVGTCHSTGLRGTASHNYASTMSLYRPRGHRGFRSRAPVIAVCIAGHRSRCLRPSSEACSPAISSTWRRSWSPTPSTCSSSSSLTLLACNSRVDAQSERAVGDAAGPATDVNVGGSPGTPPLPDSRSGSKL